jgi:CheY-like chemotaxis protein
MSAIIFPDPQIHTDTELADFWGLYSLVAKSAGLHPSESEEGDRRENAAAQAPQKPLRVLIADNDRAKCLQLRELICACEHEVVDAVTAGGIAAIQSYARHSPDVVLLEAEMHRLNGFTVCQNLLSRNPDAKIVLMSDRMDENDLSIVRSGAMAFLRKPLQLEDVREVLGSLAA